MAFMPAEPDYVQIRRNDLPLQQSRSAQTFTAPYSLVSSCLEIQEAITLHLVDQSLECT